MQDKSCLVRVVLPTKGKRKPSTKLGEGLRSRGEVCCAIDNRRLALKALRALGALRDNRAYRPYSLNSLTSLTSLRC